MEENLGVMECKGLLARNWNLQDEEMVSKLTTTKTNK